MKCRRATAATLTTFWIVLTAIACRQGEPMSDPKMPSNSPVPEIDRSERDPKTAPSPQLGDAG